MNFTLILSAITAAAGFGLAWNLQAHQITKMELTHANERISIQRTARTTIERTTTAVIQAQNAAAARVSVLRRESDAARVSVDGLRDDLDVTRRAAATTIDACNRHANTVSKLLVASATVNRELAQICDGHASDVRTLTEAWPK